MPASRPTSLHRRRLLQGSAAAASLAAAGLARTRRATAQDAVEITWLTDLPMAQEVADRFTETNPDVVVSVETVTFREVFQQNQVRLGAKSDNPDIVSVDAPVNAAYGFRGWLMPLDDVISQEQRDSWVDALDASSVYDGKLLSAPVGNSSQLLFWNVDLLEAAGVTGPGPEERWTWDQLHEAAKAVTKDGVFGFQFEQFNRIYQLQPLAQGKGAKVIGDDGLTVKGVVDSPEWVEAFTWLSQIHNESKVAPQGNLVVSELFIAQQLAMTIRGTWAIKSLIDADLPFRWQAAPHPYWGGEVFVPTDFWHLGVNPNSANTAEAARFVAWASSVEGARAWRELANTWPPHEVLLREIFDDPANADWPARANSVAAAESEHAEPRPLTVGYLEYEEILSDAFEDIRNGSDVEESLTGAADRIDREMEKYR